MTSKTSFAFPDGSDLETSLRQKMVRDQIAAAGVRDPAVLSAMETVPRSRFVPPDVRHLAYADAPLPIGLDQTISQPYIVAYMTELLELKATDRVLEVGTGSGYQTAILAKLVKEVYSIEILESLQLDARRILSDLGFSNIFFRVGDGSKGWKEHAPYNKIITAAASQSGIPAALADQLADNGRMVIPVGGEYQDLVLAVKRKGKLETRNVLAVRFVPLVEDK